MPLSGAEVICQIMCGITFPISYTACCGASALLDALLTERSLLLLTRNLYNRSRIVQNFFNLCGIAAMGEIFRFGGGFCLMEFYGTRRQRPFATRSRISFRRAVSAFGT